MKKTGKTVKSGGKSGQETRMDRKSGTGMTGSPKKGGHGGKFTWSGDSNFSVAELGGFDRAVVDNAIDPKSDDLD
ncbi:hypothetical protein R6Q59_016466 [Mikania micrantha]|uniref:Programmed cell death protein 4-like n=1 Tax=Mikania micrantha TaxID=192012 RepID=A0A5N6PM06_9ASTR|nr:hypothetical protein E3N88_09669 [Mikania micrantha]